jgi:glycosyltransferase involved in cell wall biosynthesis
MTAGSSAKPSTAVFYTTLRHVGWGAPDYVFPIAAETLLDRGIPVIAVVRPEIREHPRVREVAQRGAQIFSPPPLIYRRGRLSELTALWHRVTGSAEPLRRAIQDAPRPHLFVDQGGAFNFLEEPLLHRLLNKTGATFDVFFRSHAYLAPMGDENRHRAIDFLKRAERTLFNSRWTREVVELQLAHRLENAEFFHEVVRFPHDAPLPWPTDRTIRLAAVNRFDCHHKGLDVLFQALALLSPTLPPWTMDIHGRGPDEPYLRELAAWLKLGERVRFRPFIEDVREVWKRCHLLVLVSRYEGFGVAMLEAMACGRPVLRTPYGGCAEWIEEGETGFVCPAPEPSLIAATLEKAIGRFSCWSAMGQTAHARVRTQLNPHPESIYLRPFGIEPAKPVGPCLSH